MRTSVAQRDLQKQLGISADVAKADLSHLPPDAWMCGFESSMCEGGRGEYQYQFIHDKSSVRLFAGGRGGGKTLPCCLILLRLAIQLPRSISWIARVQMTELKATTIANMKGVVDTFTDRYGVDVAYTADPPKFTFPNGSVIEGIEIGKASKLKGANIDALFVDQLEEVEEEEFKESLARVRGSVAGRSDVTGRIILATANYSGGWLDEKVIAPFLKDSKSRPLGFNVHFASQDMNPGITDQDKARMLMMLGGDRAEYERLHGKLPLLRATDAIYPDFEDDEFMDPDDFGTVREGEQVYIGMDLGWKKDPTVIYCIVIRNRRAILFAEITGREKQPEDYVAMTDEWIQPCTYPLVYCGHDANISTRAGRSLEGYLSTADLFRNGGWNVLASRHKVEEGLAKIRQLRRVKRIILVRGRCPRLIESTARYRWGEGDKPHHDYSDPQDALRYGLTGDSVWYLVSEGMERAMASIPAPTQPVKKQSPRSIPEGYFPGMSYPADSSSNISTYGAHYGGLLDALTSQGPIPHGT